jgi:hypothetical protein
LQSGQERPQPSAEPVLVTVAPMTTTKNMPATVAMASGRRSGSQRRVTSFISVVASLWFGITDAQTGRQRHDVRISSITGFHDEQFNAWRTGSI